MNATEHPLSGLAGDNPLGFLAAVGTLRATSHVWPADSPRLAWQLRAGRWIPLLRADRPWSPQSLCDELAPHLVSSLVVPADWPDVPVSNDQFAEEVAGSLKGARSAAGALDACGWLASQSWAERDKGFTRATLFKMVSGQQRFLEYVRELARLTSADHLRHALFEPWTYCDERPSLRWDPADDRRYALRDSDPSDTNRNPIRTVRGANRLAVEALAFFPVVPVGSEPATRGFARGKAGWSFTWPVWCGHAGVGTVGSLVAHPELSAAAPDPTRLRPLGVVEVFRSGRTTAYYSNFTPARALWGTVGAVKE